MHENGTVSQTEATRLVAHESMTTVARRRCSIAGAGLAGCASKMAPLLSEDIRAGLGVVSVVGAQFEPAMMLVRGGGLVAGTSEPPPAFAADSEAHSPCPRRARLAATGTRVRRRVIEARVWREDRASLNRVIVALGRARSGHARR